MHTVFFFSSSKGLKHETVASYELNNNQQNENQN